MILSTVALGVAHGGLASGQAVSASSPEPTPIEVKRWVAVRTSGTLATPIRAQVGGLQSAAMAGDGPGPWQTVLYLAAPLSDPDVVERLGELLAESASEWTALGTVEVVVADPFPFRIAGPTQDASEIADALRYLAEEAVGAGELGELIARGRTHDARQLMDEHAAYLLEELASTPERGARAVVLIDWPTEERMPPAPNEPENENGQHAVHQQPADGLVDDGPENSLASTLAAIGWVGSAVVAEETSSPLAAPLADLVQTTSGLVTHAANVVRLAEDLRSRSWVRVDFPGNGPPQPLALTDTHNTALAHPRWISGAAPREVLVARAQRALAESTEDELFGLSAALSLAPEPLGGVHTAQLELRAPPSAALRQARSGLRVALVVPRVDAQPEVHEVIETLSPVAATNGWIYQAELSVPSDAQDAVVVIEDIASGRWAAVPANLALQPGNGSAPTAVVQRGTLGTSPTGSPTTTAAATDLSSTVLRLLPPRRPRTFGNTRFEALTTTADVFEVAFWLDGAEQGRDDKPPFSFTIDLGSEVRPHTIRAVGYDADRVPLGEDTLRINTQRRPFRVSIIRVEAAAGGRMKIVGEVDLPADRAIVQAAFFKNDQTVQEISEPPYEVTIDASNLQPSDYVRLFVELDDGSSLEDVWLLSQGAAERIEVNLLELHVVALDRAGKPVDDLTAEEFRVKIDGEEQTVERFSEADEVPLLLGLVIDSSGSMETLMNETQRAAAQFLGATLIDGDEAFVVDFDNRPRLAQDTTGAIRLLLASLATLRPDGATALYDALVFSLLQFQEAESRRAIVLLTDGRDQGSEFGARRTIQYARRLGVPIYIIDLSPILNPRNTRQTDLEGVVEKTGGQIYFIRETSELTEAYAQINAELRSQYVLAVSTERRLNLDEIDKIVTEVTTRRGVRTRTVVDGRQLN